MHEPKIIIHKSIYIIVKQFMSNIFTQISKGDCIVDFFFTGVAFNNYDISHSMHKIKSMYISMNKIKVHFNQSNNQHIP